MKNLYLILACLFIGCVSTKTTATVQQNKKVTHTKGYKPLNSFKNDTLQYLTYNLIDRKNTYVGKELNFLLDDLEVEVKSYIYSPGSDLKVYSITLMLERYNTAMLMKYRNEKPIALTISFNSPIDVKLVHDNRTNNSPDWTKNQTDFYGKIIIKDIYLQQMKK